MALRSLLHFVLVASDSLPSLCTRVWKYWSAVQEHLGQVTRRIFDTLRALHSPAENSNGINSKQRLQPAKLLRPVQTRPAIF
jgi:hypothetical protein